MAPCFVYWFIFFHLTILLTFWYREHFRLIWYLFCVCFLCVWEREKDRETEKGRNLLFHYCLNWQSFFFNFSLDAGILNSCFCSLIESILFFYCIFLFLFYMKCVCARVCVCVCLTTLIARNWPCFSNKSEPLKLLRSETKRERLFTFSCFNFNLVPTE